MNVQISVVMPVYNGDRYLEEAINSILEQSFPFFEFIIINDGSTDKTSNIIDSYKDSRIIVLNNEENRGLIYSLNRGIDKSKGKYIARMDADDFCHKDRFHEQWKFMERHPEIGICGTAYNSIVNDSILKKRIMTSNPFQNKANLMFFPILAHPSVMMRKSVLDENGLRYREEYKNAEDYGLWVEASKYTLIANISKVLLNYRILEDSITRQANRNFEKRFEVHKRIYRKYFEEFGLELSEDELKLHFIISDNTRFRMYNTYSSKDIREYLSKVLKLFQNDPYYKYISYVVSKRMLILSFIQKNYCQSVKSSFSFLYNKVITKF